MSVYCGLGGQTKEYCTKHFDTFVSIIGASVQSSGCISSYSLFYPSNEYNYMHILHCIMSYLT